MQAFVANIIDFIDSIMSAIYTKYYNTTHNTNYYNFLNKNIFMDNSIIGLNITWYELFRFVFVWVLIILFIVLFVKFIFKILGLFRFNRLND